MTKQVIHWYSRDELRQVFEELYSDDEVQKRHALGRIAVWRCRCVGSLPIAIESTDFFISAILEHKRAIRDGNLEQNDLHLRTLYSMALMRFVNHITEKGQTKTFALPIVKLAAECRVPKWIVDLRHDAAHGKLPSLTNLSTAAQWCLGWLKREYWERQIAQKVIRRANRKSAEKRSEDKSYKDSLKDLLVSFQQMRFAVSQMGGKRPSQMQNCLGGLQALLVELSDASFHCLLDDGYMVPNEEQLAALKVDIEELTTLQDCIPSLPVEVSHFWKPILDILTRLKLIPEFLHHVVAQLTEEWDLRNTLLYGWAMNLVESMIFTEGRLPITRQKVLIQKVALVKHPYSIHLLEALFQKMGPKVLAKDKKESLKSLMKTYVEKSKIEKKRKREDTESKACGESGFSLDEALQVPQEIASSNPWRLCTDVYDWRKCPIGVLPGQTLTYRNLELSYAGGDCDDDGDDEGDRIRDQTPMAPPGSPVYDDVVEADLSSITNVPTEEDMTEVTPDLDAEPSATDQLMTFELL